MAGLSPCPQKPFPAPPDVALAKGGDKVEKDLPGRGKRERANRKLRFMLMAWHGSLVA